MEIAVYGSGYVGLVTGACLADVGNSVTCIDIDSGKIERLKKGEIPIYEPGLEEMVVAAETAGRLRYTTDARDAANAEVHFIAVGTPEREDGSADLSYVEAVAKTIAETAKRKSLVVTKSTVPVGTSNRIRNIISETAAARGNAPQLLVASNPEFLKEGAAIEDFMKPDRIIIGVDNEYSEKLLRKLYAPFNRSHDKLVVMDIVSSEFTKYAANSMLATKISFINEMALIAEKVGADIDRVRIGIGADPRIGYHFIYPGCGYGGSCFPKDVKALAYTARMHGVDPRILETVDAVNERQKQVLGKKLVAKFGEDLNGLVVAVWGLAFKPNTDDMRAASSLVLIDDLLSRGATVNAYDPVAMRQAKLILGQRVNFCASSIEAVSGADALVLVTEWKEFRSPDLDAIAQAMRKKIVFDGRNILDATAFIEEGFEYYGIGRFT